MRLFLWLFLNRYLRTDGDLLFECEKIVVVHADAALGGARSDARRIVRAVDADAVPRAA